MGETGNHKLDNYRTPINLSEGDSTKTKDDRTKSIQIGTFPRGREYGV